MAAFNKIKPSFPHETTASQFFTESDFESYRGLGEFLAGNIIENAENNDVLGLDGLFKALRSLAPLATQPGEAETATLSTNILM